MDIFLDERDRERFMLLLFVCNNIDSVVVRDLYIGRSLGETIKKIKRSETLVDIGVYCFMPNHFHLLLHEKIEGGITKFMGKLLTGYSMYFNKKYERTGSLFESRFKAEYVDKDEYLKYLFSYIHLNPVKLIESKWKEVGIVDKGRVKKYLEDYKYSSYIDYLGEEREEKLILNQDAFPGYFDEFKDFEKFIDEWIDYNKQDSLV